MKFPTFGNVNGHMEPDPIFKLVLKVLEFEKIVKIETIALNFWKIGLKPRSKEPTNFFKMSKQELKVLSKMKNWTLV